MTGRILKEIEDLLAEGMNSIEILVDKYFVHYLVDLLD